MKIGAQLYTVRDFAKTDDEILNVFRTLSGFGYKSVQVSGIAPIDRKKLRSIADEYGIEIVISHSDPNRIKNDTLALIEEHEIMGCKHIGIGSHVFDFSNEATIDDFLNEYDNAAKIINSHGMKLHYHNHAFEFQKIGKKTGYELLVENSDSKLWGFILDTYWVQVGGMNPADLILSMKGRINAIHLKDIAIVDNNQVMSEVFEGNLDWDKIIRASEASGVEFALVEQDNNWKIGPFESLETSLNNLNNYFERRGN
ncbi:MAG: sugar phosphate isomerase/epimerase [Bacillota bacterium]